MRTQPDTIQYPDNSTPIVLHQQVRRMKSIHMLLFSSCMCEHLLCSNCTPRACARVRGAGGGGVKDAEVWLGFHWETSTPLWLHTKPSLQHVPSEQALM